MPHRTESDARRTVNSCTNLASAGDSSLVATVKHGASPWDFCEHGDDVRPQALTCVVGPRAVVVSIW